MDKLTDSLRLANDYYLDDQNMMGIHAISEIDSRIIYHFVSIVSKLDIDENLVELLKAYKTIQDKDFERLIDIYDKETIGGANKNPMVNIQGQFIGFVKSIFSFTRGEYYDSKKSILFSTITINRTENLKTPYANTVIFFPNDEEMEKEFENLKNRLSKHSNLIFI